MSKVAPGTRVAVWRTDDGVWHEGLVLHAVMDELWTTCSPDGDIYAEFILSTWPDDGP